MHDRPVRTWTGPLGIEFVWVGAPGNKDDEPQQFGHRFGGVNYGYWTSRTEITNTHYTAFLNAVATKGDPYGLYHPAEGGWPDDIRRFVNPDGTFRYEIAPGAENLPVVRMSHRKIFRFMNWLHNEMPNDPRSTNNGAYDTSQWGFNGDGWYIDSMEHLSDARFWMPTEDEWYKAAYYDPDKFGPGQPGYWRYPTMHDEEPDTWNQDGADPYNSAIYGTAFSRPVGTVPLTMSPWGAWDMAGNAREYIPAWQTDFGDPSGIFYVTRGSKWSAGPSFDDKRKRGIVSAPFGDLTDWDRESFRIATTIPAPGGLGVLLAGTVLSGWMRKRRVSSFAPYGALKTPTG